MQQTDKQVEFETRLRARMAEGRALDGPTLSRLKQARQAALRELADRKNPFFTAPGGWLTAGGALAAGVMVALLLRQGGVGPDIPGYAPAEDIEIILSEGDLELYEELEFYAWVAMQPEVG